MEYLNFLKLCWR